MTTPAARGSSGIAAKAAKRFPSAASRTRSSCETAAPEIGGIGGEESSSKHMLRQPTRCPPGYRNGARRHGRAATFFEVNEYLTLIEQLVREGKSEREIERIVKQVVREDVEALEDDVDELPDAA